MAECKEAIKEIALRAGRNLYFSKNEEWRCRVKCKGFAGKKCPFYFYASRMLKTENTIQLKCFTNEHICTRITKHKWCTSKWMATAFATHVRDNPAISTSKFRELVLRTYALDVSINQVYRAKQRALKEIVGNMAAQYELLQDYGHELKRVNPGTSVYIKSQVIGNTPIFERMFVLFGALREGFLRGCTRIIGVDGCHLKGPYPGQLLTAVGIDANNGLFPIAFSIVEIENKETWTWFFDHFIEDVGIQGEGAGWVIMSDKQKGLELCIESLLPLAKHRNCVGHLQQNFKKVGHGGLALKNQLWACARATTVPWFEREMEKLNELKHEAYLWLKDKEPAKWSRSHFEEHTKCDMLLNNLAESFNKAILNARDKPVLTMLEMLRSYLMLRLASKRDVQWNQSVGPRIVKIIDNARADSCNFIVAYAGEQKYQVTHMRGRLFSVDLKNQVCSCRKWSLTGLPCPHAMGAINHRQQPAYEYVSEYYKRSMYDAVYKGYISPMADQQDWPKIERSSNSMKPPHVKPQPGRRKTKRIRPPEEIAADAEKLKRFNVNITCSICKGHGHNKRTCPQVPIEERQAQRYANKRRPAIKRPQRETEPEPPSANQREAAPEPPRARVRTRSSFQAPRSTTNQGSSSNSQPTKPMTNTRRHCSKILRSTQ